MSQLLNSPLSKDTLGAEHPPTRFLEWAQRPPMGWNSWDCFGAAVNEEQTRANAVYMRDKLARYGWQYVVVDIQWYEPEAVGHEYRDGAPLAMDACGRLQPALNRFPSADNGAGFRPLADFVHSLGLKFGIHLMRGIPRQAARRNTPILGVSHGAADIADTVNVCPWNPDMYGVDMAKPGAQQYYDSVFRQIADWEVDFVKVDDLTGHDAEIAAIRRAIDATGRPMPLSVSPGPTALASAGYIAAHANMWRISDDFWDDWTLLKEQLDRCAAWADTGVTGPGCFPDADMLPLGAIRMHLRQPTRFSRDEQVTLMTVWSICRSPLMMGGHMPDNDEFTLSLLTNERVLAVNQESSGNRQLWRRGDEIAWIADVPNSPAKYLALVNAADAPMLTHSDEVRISVALADLGFAGTCRVDDLWTGESGLAATGTFAPFIPYHGAGLYRVAPASR